MQGLLSEVAPWKSHYRPLMYYAVVACVSVHPTHGKEGYTQGGLWAAFALVTATMYAV